MCDQSRPFGDSLDNTYKRSYRVPVAPWPHPGSLFLSTSESRVPLHLPTTIQLATIQSTVQNAKHNLFFSFPNQGVHWLIIGVPKEGDKRTTFHIRQINS